MVMIDGKMKGRIVVITLSRRHLQNPALCTYTMEVIFIFIYIIALSQSHIAVIIDHVDIILCVCSIVLFTDSLFVIRKICFALANRRCYNDLAFLMTLGICSILMRFLRDYAFAK